MSTLSRNHRTAVFVRTFEDDSDSERERKEAFVGSLGREPNYADGGTIKVDVYSVFPNGAVESGLVWPGPVAPPAALVAAAEAAGYSLVAETPAPAGTGYRLSSPNLRAMAQDAGYTQNVILDN
jgi:hypothetical protein